MSGRDNNEPTETPVDLAAVQADDALLDMLGGIGSASRGIGPTRGDTDAELTRVLMAWRRNAEAEPIGELVSTDTALAVIAAARKPAPRRNPVLSALAAAAAVLVIAFSAVSLSARSAEPGDQLWPLTKVLYSQYARSMEAAVMVQGKIDEARTALEESRPEQAKELLVEAQQTLGAVGDSEGHTDLAFQTDQIEDMLEGTLSPTETPKPTVTESKPAMSGQESTTPAPTSTSELPSTTTPSATSVPPTLESAPPTELSASAAPSTPPSEPAPRSAEPTAGASASEGSGVLTTPTTPTG